MYYKSFLSPPCYQNGISKLIYTCWFFTDPHTEGGIFPHLQVEGMSTKGNMNKNLYPLLWHKKCHSPAHDQKEKP